MRGSPLLHLLLALSLTLPFAGYYGHFVTDDWLFLVRLADGKDGVAALATNLYVFFDGDSTAMAAKTSSGEAPWFTNPELQWAFLRPLTALSFVLDHTLFGLWVLGWKLHSALWHTALVGAVYALFRTRVSASTSALGATIFAASGTQFQSATWISARHATISGVFAVLAVALVVRSPESKAARVGSLAMLMVALSAGETALGAVVFIGCFFAWHLGFGVRWLRALAPYAVVVALWLFIYRFADYGAYGSDVYVDPLAEPWRFLTEAPVRIGHVSAMQLLAVPSALLFFSAGARAATGVAGLMALGLVALLTWGVWRRLPTEDSRTLTWVIPATLLSMFPALVGGTRGLVFSSVGVSLLLACVLRELWRHRGRWLVLGVPFGLITLVLSPLSWVVLGRVQDLFSDRFEALMTNARFDIEGDTAVLLNAPAPYFGGPMSWFRARRGLPGPRCVIAVSYATAPQQLTRSGPNAFVLQNPQGFDNIAIANMFRPTSEPLTAGSIFASRDFEAKVLDVDENGATAVRFTFHESLPPLVVWDGEDVREQALPVGASPVTIQPAPPILGL